MPHDLVAVRYPDGKARSVTLAVPLHRIQAAVIRNAKRLNPSVVADYKSDLPAEITAVYHDDPFTMAQVSVTCGATKLTGIGFAKRKASDRRNPGAGIALAVYRAAWNAVVHLPLPAGE